MNKSERIRRTALNANVPLRASMIAKRAKMEGKSDRALVNIVLNDMKKKGLMVKIPVEGKRYGHLWISKEKAADKCAAKTAKGNQCKHYAAKGNKLCSVHIGKEKKPKKPVKKVEKKRQCTIITAKGKRCRAIASRTSTMCSVHIGKSKRELQLAKDGIEASPKKKMFGKPLVKISAEESKRIVEATRTPTPPNPISDVFDELKEFLLEKNGAYGDSVLDPLRVFSKAEKDEQIRVRIDDKLSRLVRGHPGIETDKDIIKDLVGYLVLLLVSMED